MLKESFAAMLVLGPMAAWRAADGGASLPLVDAMFQDHAVLQRNRPIPIWGRAQPGEAITVELDGHRVVARVDDSGHWQASLPSMPAGGPYSLTIAAGSDFRQTLTDVLVGDVFLCSGQSNMELPVANSLNAVREIATSTDDSIRVLSVRHASSAAALPHFKETESWVAAGPDTNRDIYPTSY